MAAIGRDEICDEAIFWLKEQQSAAIEFCTSHDISLSWTQAQHHPVPLLFAWANLDQYHVELFGFEPDSKSVRYALKRTGSFSAGYVEDERDRKPSAGPNLNVLVGKYVSSQVRTAHNRYDGVAFAGRLFQSTLRYYAKLGSARNLGRVVARARDDGSLDIDGGPDSETLYSALTIFLVSALEVGLQDTFSAHRRLWFRHLSQDRTMPRQLRKIAKRLTRNRKERRRLVRSLRRTKWIPDKCREVFAAHPALQNISFQDMDGKRGAKWAYRAFFGISLADCARAGDTAGWEIVRNVIDRRHLVIHSNSPAQPDRLMMTQEIEMSKQYFGRVLRKVTTLDPLDRSTPL